MPLSIGMGKAEYGGAMETWRWQEVFDRIKHKGFCELPPLGLRSNLR
jgi:hypothetical protein